MEPQQEEQISSKYDEQQQKIIKYVIKNAPYGEVQDVLKDLSKLVDNFSDEDPFIQQLLREHNEEHLAIAKGENGYQYLTTPISFQDGCYIDQENSLKLKVNLLTLDVVSQEQIEIKKNPAFENYRNCIQKELTKYLENYYKPDNYQSQIFIDWDEEGFTFYLCISCKNLSLKNFHGGEWVSEWKIDQNGLVGKVRINTHYFEDGNVALKDIKNIKNPFTFTGDNTEQEAKDIVKIIQQEESKIHNSLDEIYENMNNMFFKNMRRTLPVTNQKMEWNLYAQKMRGNLGQ